MTTIAPSTAHSDGDCRLPADILKITVRIEVPVIFPFDPDTTLTWDDIRRAAVEEVEGYMPARLREATEEIVALTGPGSGGHYHGESASETLAAPHLSASLPVEESKA